MLKLDSLIDTATKRIIIVVRLGNLLRRHVNIADKIRTFPRTEINRSFVNVGQILFHCNLGFRRRVWSELTTTYVYQNPFHNFLRKHVILEWIVLKFQGQVVCGAGSLVFLARQ